MISLFLVDLFSASVLLLLLLLSAHDDMMKARNSYILLSCQLSFNTNPSSILDWFILGDYQTKYALIGQTVGEPNGSMSGRAIHFSSWCCCCCYCQLVCSSLVLCTRVTRNANACRQSLICRSSKRQHSMLANGPMEQVHRSLLYVLSSNSRPSLREQEQLGSRQVRLRTQFVHLCRWLTEILNSKASSNLDSYAGP